MSDAQLSPIITALRHITKDQTLDDPHFLLKFYQDVLDHLPMIVSVVHKYGEDDFRVVIANRVAVQASGLPSLVGIRIRDMLTPAEADRFQEHYQECISTKQVIESEEPITTGHSVIIWLHSMFIPMADAEGNVSSIITLNQDITQRKHRELEEQRMHHEIVARQAAILAELSTPLLTISDTTLVMPLIGSIDSRRMQQMIATLLEGVAESRATKVILDITGVPIVDTHIANVLLQSARAVRLLGAQIILSGIRPEVAQTLIDLDINLQEIITRSTLQSAIATALKA